MCIYSICLLHKAKTGAVQEAEENIKVVRATEVAVRATEVVGAEH